VSIIFQALSAQTNAAVAMLARAANLPNTSLLIYRAFMVVKRSGYMS
jgi:hypothetical protein